MTYISGRICHDADSHVMETRDWLEPFLEGEFAEKARKTLGKGFAVIDKQIAKAQERQQNAEETAKIAENPIAGPKGWLGYGAFDTTERKAALDNFGIASQLVFPTASLAPVTRALDLESAYGIANGCNKAMAAFCNTDPRLIGVAYVPLDNPSDALAEIDAAIEAGNGAIMVSAAAPGERSPGHPDLDPIWQRLSDRKIPFMLHIGPGTKTQPKVFHNNGRPRSKDLHGGGENLRFCDYMTLWFAPQMFLTAMIYDGVFERFPNLRGGIIESGAGWVPDFLRQLDMAHKSFKRTDEYLQEMSLLPSEYIRRAVKFTPFPGEDVGIMIKDAGPDLFLFSTDYPHPEGTNDPVGRFERTMGDIDEAGKDKFYRWNFEEMMYMPSDPAAAVA